MPLISPNYFKVLIFSLIFSLSPPDVQAAESARAEAWGKLLASFTDIKTIDLLSAIVGDKPENDIPPALLAHAAFLAGRPDIAAFYFSVDTDINPGNIESMSNLAGVLVELNAADPTRFPPVMLDWAEELARAALQQRPDDAGLKNNLSVVLRAKFESGAYPGSSTDEALELSKAASDFDPNSDIYWTNLARLHALRKESEEVDRALEMARQANPGGAGYRLTAVALNRVPVPYVPDAGRNGGQSEPLQCNVDFKCEEICPKSIIGQVNFVSCKLENETQQNICLAGKPYATAYNCEEEFPVFGAVPGLSNVASVCLPGICLHFKLKGNGDVDIRFEAGRNIGPVKPIIQGDARYSRKNGFSVIRYSAGVKISLYNKSEAGNLSGKIAEINPIEVKASGSGGTEKLEASVMGKVLINF